MRSLLLALLALLVVRAVIHHRQPLHEQFLALVPTPDCCPFLDEHLLRRV